MGILSVNEIHSGRRHSYDAVENQNSYTRVFRVVTDSPLTGMRAVKNADGIPRRGYVYSTSTEIDLAARVKTIDADQDADAPCVWEVRVDYDTNVKETDEHPLERAPEITWGFSQFTRAVWQDRDGKAILNSAGQYFDPPLEVDDSRPVLTITRNEAGFNAALAIAYQDAVNADAFMGFAPGTVKVASISAQSTQETVNDETLIYWRVTYEFHFRREGWQPKVLDQGRYQKQNGKLVPIHEYDEEGNELDTFVTDPVPLNGNGLRLDNPGPTTAQFITVNVYKSLTFSVFNF